MAETKAKAQDIRKGVDELGLKLSDEQIDQLVSGVSVPLKQDQVDAAGIGIPIKCWGSNPKCCLYLTIWPPGVEVKCDF